MTASVRGRRTPGNRRARSVTSADGPSSGGRRRAGADEVVGSLEQGVGTGPPGLAAERRSPSWRRWMVASPSGVRRASQASPGTQPDRPVARPASERTERQHEV